MSVGEAHSTIRIFFFTNLYNSNCLSVGHTLQFEFFFTNLYNSNFLKRDYVEVHMYVHNIFILLLLSSQSQYGSREVQVFVDIRQKKK